MENVAYCVFETEHGVLNTRDNRDVRILSIDGLGTAAVDIETMHSPYAPGAMVIGKRQDVRVITMQLQAPKGYRPQMIKLFAPGREGKLTVNWGGRTRYIGYVVQDAEVMQESVTRRLTVDATLLCPDVYFNDMHDFGENIAAVVPLIAFPNLWYVDTGMVADYRRFESAVALQNDGDVPIGLKFNVRAAKGRVLNPVIYLSENVYFRVYVDMQPNDLLEISTVRRGKYVRLNGGNALNRTDMTSTFFEIEPGAHKVYYDAEDGMENMAIFLHRRPQYLGV